MTELAAGLVDAIVQAAHFERRQGAVSAGRALFDEALKAEESKEGTTLNPPGLAESTSSLL